MTETDWLACSDPAPMLAFLQASGKASDRKLRLFACACCRRVWPLLMAERSRLAVEVAERYADGTASRAELAAAHTAAMKVFNAHDKKAIAGAPVYLGGCVKAAEATGWVTDSAFGAVSAAAAAATVFWAIGSESEREAHCHLLRDIFRIPFESHLSIGASSFTPKIVALAQDIYDTRSFDALFDLAQACSVAGCMDAMLLEHLRAPGLHCRGCWALDLILGKL